MPQAGGEVVPVLLLGGRAGPSTGHWTRVGLTDNWRLGGADRGLGEWHNPREWCWHSVESLEHLDYKRLEVENQVVSLPLATQTPRVELEEPSLKPGEELGNPER